MAGITFLSLHNFGHERVKTGRDLEKCGIGMSKYHSRTKDVCLSLGKVN